MSAEADITDPRIKEMPRNRERPSTYTGKCFVVKDNIDTDQIIPAEYLTLVPSKVRCLTAEVFGYVLSSGLRYIEHDAEDTRSSVSRLLEASVCVSKKSR